MQKKGEELFKELVSHCKEYGFIFQSSEIYDGLAAVYDYGHYGAELKNNIRNYWWQSMVHHHDNIVGIDSAIFMHPTIWKASGHVDAFNDPLIDNKDSKKRYRADALIEDHIQKIEQKIEKEVEKAEKRFGEKFDKRMFLETNERVLELKKRIESISKRMNDSLNAGNLEDVKALIQELEIVCPVSGTKNWTDVRQFNLMFSTEMGSTAEGANKIYLRPETGRMGCFNAFISIRRLEKSVTSRKSQTENIFIDFLYQQPAQVENFEVNLLLNGFVEGILYHYDKKANPLVLMNYP